MKCRLLTTLFLICGILASIVSVAYAENIEQYSGTEETIEDSWYDETEYSQITENINEPSESTEPIPTATIEDPQPILPATTDEYISDDFGPESEYTTDNAIIVFANNSGETISGNGETNTSIEMQEKTQDDFINEKIDEMATHFGEDYSNEQQEQEHEQNQVQQDQIQQDQTEQNQQVEDVFIYNEEQSNIFLEEIQTEDHTDVSLVDYYNSQEISKEIFAIDAGEGMVIEIEEFTIPDYQLISFADLYGQLREERYRFNLENIDTQLFMGVDGKLYDTQSGNLSSSAFMTEYLKEMFDWLHNDHDSDPSAMTEYWENQALESLIDYLGGGIQEEQLGNSDIYIGVPISNEVLKDSLYSYISALHNIGVHNIKVTKYTVYTAESYSVRTVRASSPVYPLQYHWTVSNLSGDNQIDEWTETQPYIRILFESAGDYYIKVAQNKNVIRNNKVSGYKTEIWTLNNGDIFDGLVFYNHTTTFESFLAADIGPAVEELQLTEDSFIANITEKMVGQTQMLDENGYLHQSADGFTTERH